MTTFLTTPRSLSFRDTLIGYTNPQHDFSLRCQCIVHGAGRYRYQVMGWLQIRPNDASFMVFLLDQDFLEYGVLLGTRRCMGILVAALRLAFLHPVLQHIAPSGL